MSNVHVESSEVGTVRIFLAVGEKRPRKKGLRNFLRYLCGRRPIYMEIVDEAKKQGLLQGTAHNTYYGFSGGGAVQAEMSELPNPSMSMCVELIGPKEALDQFCRQHSELLEGKAMFYARLDAWRLRAS